MPTTSNPLFRAHPSIYHPGQAKGVGIGNVFRRRHRKLSRDNILAISKGSIRKLARRGGIRRIQWQIYDEARAAIKARLTTILHYIIHVLESDGPMYEVETMHRQNVEKARKTVMVRDVVFALKGLGLTLYGFGWYDSGVEPSRDMKGSKTAANTLPDSSDDSQDGDQEEEDDDSSDETSIVG
ncbi:hypothetical protein DV736_g3792, partial [Chaetothyriales sp. CBS 134916]